MMKDSSNCAKEINLPKKIWYYFLMLVIVFLTLEIGLQIVFYALGRNSTNSLPEAGDYVNDSRQSFRMIYEPFIGWRRQEYHGRYVNVSRDGVRKTWNPQSQSRELCKNVFCFGGSTLWGLGARDDFTIPSLLSKKLNRGGEKYFVTNYGESGYTLTQEIIHLLLLLKAGRIPDSAIFYDGINDVYAAYQNGEPGLVQNLAENREILALTVGKKLLGRIKKNSAIYRAWQRLSLIVNAGERTAGLVGSAYSEDELNKLSKAITMDYVKNMGLVDSLSKIYGFKYFFLWQPVLYTNKSITPEESHYKEWNDKRQVKLFKMVYALMIKKKMPHFYNLSDILDSKQKTVYIDCHHLSEEGNEEVAERIYKIFKREGCNE